MSLEFSRRSFMKLTALTAVAVAGSSLLSGCETKDTENIIRTSAGELTVLQVTAAMGTLDSDKKTYTAPSLAGTTIEYPMSITNERDNPISIYPSNFKVTVMTSDRKTVVAKYTAVKGITISNDLADANLKNGKTSEGTVTVTLDTELESGQYIVLSYFPDLQYNEYSLNWYLVRA